MAQLNLRFLLQNTTKFPSLSSVFNPTRLFSFKSLSIASSTAFVGAAPGKIKRGAIKTVVSLTPEQLRRGRSSSTTTTTTTGKGGKRIEEKESSGYLYNKRKMEGKETAGHKSVKLKTRQINPINTTAYVQILGTGMDTQDTSPSILLFFDNQRFIFNAGEGIQRFFTEHKLKLSRLDHVFLTRVCSETAGGLPGLLLTMAGIGDDGMTVNIWGPSDLDNLISVMRSFIPNSAVVHTHSFGLAHGSEGSAMTHNRTLSTDPIILIKEEIVQISAVFLFPNGVGRSYDEAENMEPARKRPCLGSEGASIIPELFLEMKASYKPGDVAVVYICELPEIKGKFDPAKAQALGLKRGPKYRELQLGKSVMSDENDIMVHPSDVLGPSFPGPIVLFVDCPTISHIPDLLSAPALSKFFTCVDDDSENLQTCVSCIVHLSPSSVTECSEYLNWMSKFVGTQHIMAGHEVKSTQCPILKSSARLLTRLNFVCPQLFPVPGFRSLGVANNLEGASAQTKQEDGKRFHGSIPADNLLKFHLRPYARLGLDRCSVPILPTASDIVDELVSEIPEIVDASKQIAQLWNNVNAKGNENPNQIESHGSASIISGEPQIEERTDASESDFERTSNGAFQKEAQIKLPIEATDCRGTDIPKCLDGISRTEMEMVFLGTGSSQPSKYRNVSGILINMFRHGSILLDCGEGTMAQLKRRFGVNGADDVIRSLKCIWISHIHADHHAGLARILSVRKQLLKNEYHEPLLVIGPKPLRRILNAFLRVEDLNMKFLDCRQTLKASIDAFDQLSADMQDNFDGSGVKQDNSVASNLVWFKSGNENTSTIMQSPMPIHRQGAGIHDGTILDITGLHKLKKILTESGIEVLTSIPVVHCREAFGVVLQAVSRRNNDDEIIPGWKLVYSGDTRPCKNLKDAACGATVLIHEATFDDSMPEEAISKNHSLTKEAIEVGVSAGAYRIILTHFSQRYPKIPVFDESCNDKTCIAFDLMSVNLADLPFVPKINPYLKILFKNEMVTEEASEDENMTEDTAIAL